MVIKKESCLTLLISFSLLLFTNIISMVPDSKDSTFVEIRSPGNIDYDKLCETIISAYFNKNDHIMQPQIKEHLRPEVYQARHHILNKTNFSKYYGSTHLDSFVKKLVTEAIEDAYGAQEHESEELRIISQESERKASVAKITAIAGVVTAIVTAIVTITLHFS